MARELGMSPMKLGKLDNHEHEPWKMPLREYIEHLYLKRFGKPAPDNITSIDERWRVNQEKKEARRAGPAKTPYGASMRRYYADGGIPKGLANEP